MLDDRGPFCAAARFAPPAPAAAAAADRRRSRASATPGAPPARDRSTELNRCACATGLRTKTACNIRGSTRSAMNCPWPLSSRRSSRRNSEPPDIKGADVVHGQDLTPARASLWELPNPVKRERPAAYDRRHQLGRFPSWVFSRGPPIFCSYSADTAYRRDTMRRE